MSASTSRLFNFGINTFSSDLSPLESPVKKTRSSSSLKTPHVIQSILSPRPSLACSKSIPLAERVVTPFSSSSLIELPLLQDDNPASADNESPFRIKRKRQVNSNAPSDELFPDESAFHPTPMLEVNSDASSDELVPDESIFHFTSMLEASSDVFSGELVPDESAFHLTPIRKADSDSFTDELSDVEDKVKSHSFRKGELESKEEEAPGTPRASRTLQAPRTPEASERGFCSTLKFNDVEYPTRAIQTTGQMNYVWEFAVDTEIVIKGKRVSTSQLIIKSPREARKSDKHEPKHKFKVRNHFTQELNENIKTFQYFSEPTTLMTLKKLGMSLPRYYFTPLDEQVSGGKGNFWIVEKMKSAVTFEEWQSKDVKSSKRFKDLSEQTQNLLLTIRTVLTYMWENRCNLSEKLRLLDFHIGNVMYNFQGELCYIDGGMHWEDDHDGDLGCNVNKLVTMWSAGNEHVRCFLSENLRNREE